MTSAIETVHLTKRYRRTVALDSVTLEIPEGSVYALIGPNGAGKTTLIRLLMNMIPPSDGRARVLGVASTDISASVFERIGYVSENQKLLDAMTIRGFLDYVRPFYPSWDRNVEDELVRQFGLPLQFVQQDCRVIGLAPDQERAFDRHGHSQRPEVITPNLLNQFAIFNAVDVKKLGANPNHKELPNFFFDRHLVERLFYPSLVGVRMKWTSM